jgi:RNA polymerase sporulation-specific sigma factor
LKTFQKPLTPQEESLYLTRLKEGDLAARNALIERNMRLVAHVAKKYNLADRDLEDMISIGTIGLIKAVNTFNPGKGSRLATYAAKCIDNEILMMFRAEKKYGREISLFEPIGTDKEGNEINLLDVIETDERDITERVSLQQDVQRLYDIFEHCLKDKEKLVIRMRYGLYGQKEYTQREIAAYLGISRSYVSRIEKKALEKLKKEFERRG